MVPKSAVTGNNVDMDSLECLGLSTTFHTTLSGLEEVEQTLQDSHFVSGGRMITKVGGPASVPVTCQ